MRFLKNIISFLFILCSVWTHAQSAYFLADPNFVSALKKKFPTVLRNDSLVVLEAKKITGWVDFQSQNIQNIDGIQFFERVEQLNLAENKLSKLPDLSGLLNLNQLLINHNQLTELPKIATSIQKIYAFSNQITSIDKLEKLMNLTVLHVSNNKLTSVTNLANFPNLIEFHCHQNQITEIKGLASLTKVTHLYLWENQLTDLEELSNNISLKILYINDNNLQQLPLLKNKTNLRELSLSNNYFTFSDLDFLFEIDSIRDSFYYTPMKAKVSDKIITVYDGKDILIRSLIDTSLNNLTYSLFRNNTDLIGSNTSGKFLLNEKNYKDNDVFSIRITSSRTMTLSLENEKWRIQTATCESLKTPFLAVLNNDCSKGANIKIIPSEEILQNPEISWYLKSTTSNLSYTFDLSYALINLPQGAYYFEGNSAAFCRGTTILIVPNAPNCNDVFSPNGDGQKDLFFLDKTGEAKIYNLKGECIKTLHIPAAWDGTDTNGFFVPAGYYTVIFNDSELLHLTVLK